jgi:hypothetical protein
MIPLAAFEEIIDASGVAPRIEALLPASPAPAVMGKIRCPLRPSSMTLDRRRPEILQPPGHPQACCTQQTSPCRRGERENHAET